jgi:predicted RNA-binding Zn-ribbon protein involved in translation (DUF1610 family)
MPTLKELFAEVEADPFKCPDCGKEVILSKGEGTTFKLDACPCGKDSFDLPDALLIGPESGPLSIYPKKKTG